MKKILTTVLVLLSGYFLTETLAAQPASHEYGIDDVLAFTRIGQVAASPDGKQVAFTTFQVQSAPSGKRWEYHLYVKEGQGKTSLLATNRQILSLAWSNNGKQIAYLAQGKKHLSIWIQDISNRRVKRIIEFSDDIDSFKWSPDDQYIGFIADDSRKIDAGKAILIDVDKNYLNKRLYFIPVETRVKTPKPLTSSAYSVSDFDWNPNNSQAIAFAHQPRIGADYINQTKISIIDLSTGRIMPIPHTETHTGVQPAYSPDGQWVAYRSNVEPEKHAHALNNNIQLNGRVCVTNVHSMDTHCLSNTFNENPDIIGWNKSSDGVLVWEPYKTEGFRIYELSINPSISAKMSLNPSGFIHPFSITLNNTRTVLAFAYETVSDAPEVFISRIGLYKLEQITHLQSPRAGSSPGKMEVINWKSQDGTAVDGLLITPNDYDSSKRYPLLVTVHGGPAGCWFKRYMGGCYEFMEKFEPISCYGNLLSMGFVILQPNPRGSTGYGRPFRLANFADFGGGDYQDIMAGVDYLIQQGIADPDRLAIAGWSFGGYMAAWAVSQTDRFKAAVVGDGNTDFISFCGTSDIPDYYVEYLGKAFWDDSSLYVQRAPISFVKNITTPLLILHGQDDVRVPLSQAYELYYALAKQNRPVKMLISPKTGHAPTDPDILHNNIKEINNWLKQALEPEKAKGGSIPP